ncbi:MAG TPA: efflux RND transporter periplasmic adaptor subunit [Candidatus Acidoferrales bacterium]|nr:efflux RND transporter periplasmic adaptor subunit [Candidatus Acidoferrales bacterium]
MTTGIRGAAIACVLTFSAFAALSGCAKKQTRPAAAAPQVPVKITATGTIRPTLTLAGFISPAQSVALSSSLQEPALKVNVQEGDHVRAGQVLAVLSTADLRAAMAYDIHNALANDALTKQNVYQGRLNIAQGADAVNQARANLRSAQATLVNARRDLQRYKMLYSQGYVTEQQYVTQQTTVENDLQAVRNDEAALSSAISNVAANGTMEQGLQAAKVAQSEAEARASRDQAAQEQVSINTATISSPVNGIIVNRNLNPGEYPGSRQIFTIQEEDYVFAILSASSAKIFQVPVGASVSVTVNGLRGRYPGTVAAVLDQLTPGSTNFAIKVRVPNPQGTLRSGVTVSSVISLNPVTGVEVPVSSFLDDNHDSVMTVDTSNTTHVVNVTQVATDGSNSIVSGLANGVRLVTNGQLGLSDGQKVAVQ